MNSLRKRREKVGMSISELSKISGVSPNFISEIETGRHTCSFETLEKLVFALSGYEIPTTSVRTGRTTAKR